MSSFAELLQQGASNAWLFVPTAVLLGALHGLEPGHSKTMMAAFIVAIRGTIGQAILLGLAATVSHTAIVWAVALLGLHYGSQFNAETSEPYFQIASAALILTIAGWMIYRVWRDQRRERAQAAHDHHHDNAHDDVKRVDTGHGVVNVTVFEDGVPPRFRLYFEEDGERRALAPGQIVAIETLRKDGARQRFEFLDRGEYLESVDEIPEPHEFTAHLRLAHGEHAHGYDLAFSEHDHGHRHQGLDVSTPGFQDSHQIAHASDIRRRFADRRVTTWQIVAFGLTGGLIPCPAAITVLLLCLQLKEFTLGAALVLCFSIGLALTMVISGAIAALGVRHASRRWAGFETFARRAPYVSGLLIVFVGLLIGYQGVSAL